MRKGIMTAAIAVTLAGMAIGPPSNAQEARPLDSTTDEDGKEYPCREGRRPYSPTEIVAMIGCAVDLFGPIPGGAEFAVDVGRCESGLRPRAVSASGTYRGVYQYGPIWEDFAADHYWRPEWGRRGVEEPAVWNARAQVLVTVRYVAAGGWSPWSCA